MSSRGCVSLDSAPMLAHSQNPAKSNVSPRYTFSLATPLFPLLTQKQGGAPPVEIPEGMRYRRHRFPFAQNLSRSFHQLPLLCSLIFQAVARSFIFWITLISNACRLLRTLLQIPGEGSGHTNHHRSVHGDLSPQKADPTGEIVLPLATRPSGARHQSRTASG